MKLRLGRPRRAIVFAPHPDDEVIGAAGAIAALVAGKCRVRVVIVSDGAASHPGSRKWPPRRLVFERRRESRRALRRLGVTARDVDFLALPDGSLARGDRCRRALSRMLARHHPLDLVIGPVTDDAHPDHRAVGSAIASSLRGVRRLGYRIWPPCARPSPRAAYLIGRGNAAYKRSLIRTYRTQSGVIRDDPAGFAIARHELDAFARPIEYYVDISR